MPKAIIVPEEVWTQMRLEYISTDISLRGVQKKYGVPFNQTRTRCINEKWNEHREACKEKSTQKSIDLISDHQASECVRAFVIANKVLDKLEEVVDKINPEKSDTSDVLKDIKTATSAIKDLKEIGIFRAELDRQEQMARINKLRKDAEEEDKDMEIVVKFSEDGYGD